MDDQQTHFTVAVPIVGKFIEVNSTEIAIDNRENVLNMKTGEHIKSGTSPLHSTAVITNVVDDQTDEISKTVVQGINTNIEDNTSMSNSLPVNHQHHNETQPDHEVNEKEVSLEQAREGLMKVIAYLKAHSSVATDVVPILLQLLECLYNSNIVENTQSAHCIKIEDNGMTWSEHVDDALSDIDDHEHLVNNSDNEYIDPASMEVIHLTTSDNTGTNLANTSQVIDNKEIAAKEMKYDETGVSQSDINQCEETVNVKRKRGRPKGSKAKKEISCELTENDQFKVSAEQKLTCPTCGKWFNGRSHLSRHMKIHSGEKPHKCSTCDKAFGRSSHLQRHMLMHSGRRDYLCTLCGQSFTRSSHLSRHQLIHTGVRPHKCETCGKKYAQAHDLRAHMGIHTGIRPFKCGQCDKDYTSSSALRNHERIHTADRQPYVCDHCGVAYSQRSNLDAHTRRQHTLEEPFKCPTCGKGFTRASNCKIHILIHTGQRPYKCLECNKGFSNPGTLLQHKRIHTGIKAFTCHICHKSFRQSGQFHKHVQIHAKAAVEDVHSPSAHNW